MLITGRPITLNSNGFQYGPLRDHALFQVAPQVNQQASGHRHDANLALALAGIGVASLEPEATRALWLQAHPAPSHLDRQRPDAPTAGFADALFVLDRATVIRRSSYRVNGLGKRAAMWTSHYLYQRLGNTVVERATVYRALFVGHIDTVVLTQIRQASNKGMALGGDRFKEEVERLSGRRVTPLKRGPKPKQHGGDEFLH